MDKKSMEHAVKGNLWTDFVGSAHSMGYPCANCDALMVEADFVVPTLYACTECEKVNLCIPSRDNKRPLCITYLAEKVHTPEKQAKEKIPKKSRSHGKESTLDAEPIGDSQ